MPTEQRLQDSVSVILDASGNGVVRFGPARPNQPWTITRVSVSVTTNTLEAKAFVYRGGVNPGTLISNTFAGSSGDNDPEVNQDLWSGEYLTVAWTGGDATARATATYWGTINVQ